VKSKLRLARTYVPVQTVKPSDSPDSLPFPSAAAAELTERRQSVRKGTWARRNSQPATGPGGVIAGVEATLDGMQSRLDELVREVDSYMFPAASKVEPPRAA
jgi:hypothetical protein